MSDTTLYQTDYKSKLVAAFENREKVADTAALYTRRQEAIRHFDRLGFPTTKNEEWKYTDVKNLLKKDFDFTPARNTPTIQPDKLHSLLIPDTDANVIVFVNGVFNSSLSNIISPAEELTIQDFSKATQTNTEIVEKYFGTLASYDKEAFTALNTAFARHGAFIHVPANKVVSKPVILYFIADSETQAAAAMPRNLFVASRNSQVTIVEAFLSKGNQPSFTNVVTEIVVQENANVTYTKIQNESEQSYNIGTTQVHQSRDSKFSAITVSLSGALIRNNLNIVLDAENCESHLYGLYMLNGSQHVDNHTLVDHAKPHSYSNELYKGIMDDKSTGVFNGKIFVRQDAQKTNAFQSNKNILLSKEASMNTKPQLEIFADDVKCSHGATTGQLDEDMLFYLRSRGIGVNEAKALLMYAFAADIINQISIEAIRLYVERVIANRLNQ
ncbi:Fe-S cluster assembly protein SufD [Rhodocytophaga rosea]|uniref:Fe-S cluster assembly protein SufD n=1 Tax=Rhodocytophaga rosea TaxID=2704465 RepID=A0A6C0GI04_9BACT|nr:Fe-S cluster assembly protein SufD [Rhodocytophaga rosea]QHT67589.1 Fe-S cluster assembly protein SufD [Rhodocytophaga rosea]